MRGIVGAAGYVPFRRLPREQVGAVLGSGGGRGRRAVASHDEDTTTLGFEASRLALRAVPGAAVDTMWFSTCDPAYLDKTNAASIHQALRLPAEVGAYDMGGSLRSAVGALRAALGGGGSTLVASADMRDGLPTSTDESAGGDAGAAVVVGDGGPSTPLLAELVGGSAATDEFVDRWRAPGERRSRVWEERFGETRYLALGRETWSRALKSAGVPAEEVAVVAVSGMHTRAVRSLSAKLGVRDGVVLDDLSSTVGQAGGAHPLLLLATCLEQEAARQRAGGAPAGRIVAVVHLADGADVLFLRTTDALASWHPTRTVGEQIAAGADLPYGKFLSWRGMLEVEPPRRPEPQRVSSTAAWRSEQWKFGFVGSKDRTSGAVHLPPARVSMQGGAVDDMEDLPMADVIGTVAAVTVDRMAYSPSPPVVFAVVDFDGGGRAPVELTDVDADRVTVGDRVEMTFRRLFTADGIHDYFWKARPLRAAAGTGS